MTKNEVKQILYTMRLAAGLDDFVANCKNETIGYFGCRFVDIRNVMEIAERLRINIE